MHTQKAAGLGFDLTVKYPDGWHVASRVVPNLYSPHELCAISSRPLRKVPIASDQNTPDVRAIGEKGYLIWIYYEVLGEVLGNPVIRDPERPPIPDCSRYSYPMVYSESQLFPVQLAYDWGPNILWRRVGHNLVPTARRREPAALTVMIWEGTRASADDLHAVEEVVASVSIA
jgi:hypothetical protein